MTRLHALGLAAVLLAALGFRLPQLTTGLPFIYEEDEAHHFNRAVQMVQEGRFNPKYFKKPTLHFYMRMPAVAGAFVWSVKKGEMGRLSDIQTRRAGSADGYAYTVSHARILVWTRAVTLVLSLLAVLLTGLLARTLTRSDAAALGAAWLAAVSPALVRDSGKIGVDTPLVFMCLLAMYLAVRLHDRFSLGHLAVAGLVAGLAFSTKYNAIPILALPLVACLLTRHLSAPALAVAVTMPIAGFLLGSPFVLVELPLFLNEMAFEAWHYAERGHGATATGTPGLPQALYYLGWFARQAIGYGVVALAGVGLCLILLAPAGSGGRARAVTFLFFPVLFFLLMVDQKVNFTRNVLVLIPVLSVLAMAAIAAVPRLRALRRAPVTAAVALFLLVTAQPLVSAWTLRARAAHPPTDSRVLAMDWLDRDADAVDQMAVAAELQMPAAFVRRPDVTETRFSQIRPAQLYLDGFDRVLVGRANHTPPQAELLRKEKEFEGRPRPYDRFPAHPRLVFYRVEPLSWSLLERHVAVGDHTVYLTSDTVSASADHRERCYRGSLGPEAAIDGGCWIRSRLTRVVLDAPARLPAAASGLVSLALEIRTPWTPQSCTLERGDWRSPDLCAGLPANTWERRTVDLLAEVLRQTDPWLLRVERVRLLPAARSDRKRGSRAERGDAPERAGVAIRRVTISSQPPG